MPKNPLYLIDSYSLIYRSYFAFMTYPLKNNAGKNVSALFGFARTVISLLNDGAPVVKESGKPGPVGEYVKETPKLLAAVFDSRAPTFRHKMYSEYKATREKAPEDLHAQVPLVEEFLATLNIPSLRADGFEADDIIATLAKKCQKEKRQCYILSSDKDLLQLVGHGTFEMRPAKASKNTAPGGATPGAATVFQNTGPIWEIIGPEEVRAEWGIPPDRILDYLSLVGDSSDNIPGVKGIGESTALKHLNRYGSLDAIYQNVACLGGTRGKIIAEGKKDAYFSQSLIRLVTDVPLPVTEIDELSAENLNRKAAAQVLFREGIRQSAKQLDPDISVAAISSETPENEQQNIIGSTYSADQSLFGEGVYKIVSDLAELWAILDEAAKQKILALDFETDSLDAWNSRPIGLSLALKPKEAFYVPVAPHGVQQDGTASDPNHLDPAEVRALLQPLLDDPEMKIVAHNAKYDYKVSRGWGIKRWNCKVRDTLVAAWLASPDRNNYSLDSLAEYTFDYTPIKYHDIVPKDRAFDAVPLETAARYSAEDADLCLRVLRHFEPMLENHGAAWLYENLEMPLLPVLAEMEGAGIMIEPEVLTSYGKELEAELEKLQSDSWKMAGHEFNLASTRQLQDVLFKERKLKPVKKLKTGYSTDAATLETLAREDPLAGLILRHRILAKLKSTYVDTLADLADSEKRVHTNFDQCGTATGRLASREPNLQNIPIRAEEGRRIREAFIAGPGCLLLSLDYSQIELVVLAHLSEDENLLTAFRDGTDVHARTAALIFGVGEDQVNPEQRRMAKMINFGVMYGMSSFRLSTELGISRLDAEEFITAYFNTYSGVRRFIDELIRKTQDCGYVTTILGRRRYIPTINSRNRTERAAAERIAVNTPIQGSAADIVKTAMIRLDKRLIEEKSSARLLLQVHDELILECPKDAAAKTAEIVKTEMEQAITLRVPLRVSVETGSRWGNFH